MFEGSSQQLLPSPTKVVALAKLLNTIPLEISLEQRISLYNQLESGKITPKRYLEHPITQQAFSLLINTPACTFSNTFLLWFNTAHRFSTLQKFIFSTAAITLIISAILTKEVFLLLLKAKPALENTGVAVADYCTTGLSSRIVDICSLLPDGVTAVFNMNTDNRTLPTLFANVSDPQNGPVPGTALQTISSWFNPIGWINFFTCTFKDNQTILNGHAYFGDEKNALIQASQAFPVANMQLDYDSADPVKYYLEAEVVIMLFLAELCIKIQNGGYSAYTNPLTNQDYGHSDGLERSADSFRQNAYAFAGVYGGITGVAFLTFCYFMIKKACEKWDACVKTRDENRHKQEAIKLFRTLGFNERTKIEVVTDTASECSMQYQDATLQ